MRLGVTIPAFDRNYGGIRVTAPRLGGKVGSWKLELLANI